MSFALDELVELHQANHRTVRRAIDPPAMSGSADAAMRYMQKIQRLASEMTIRQVGPDDYGRLMRFLKSSNGSLRPKGKVDSNDMLGDKRRTQRRQRAAQES